jgi:hypothetical protein
MLKNQKEKLKQIGDSKQCRESEESGIDDDFELIVEHICHLFLYFSIGIGRAKF